MLTGGTTLVEFARYRPADSGGAAWGPTLGRGGRAGLRPLVEAVDLGPVAGTEDWIAALVAESEGADAAARALYDRLIAPARPRRGGAGGDRARRRLHLVPSTG